jgi:hypothetical protein
MKIFLIPGLGFDFRIFQNIDFEDFEVEYINWIEPKLEESLLDMNFQSIFDGISGDI